MLRQKKTTKTRESKEDNVSHGRIKKKITFNLVGNVSNDTSVSNEKNSVPNDDCDSKKLDSLYKLNEKEIKLQTIGTKEIETNLPTEKNHETPQKKYK